MALIEKMSIQGIRSYPPTSNTTKAAVIEFQTPLTLIVGLNGTGKTSIIESLKFVTTGDLPPNTKAQAFIHDPKVAGEKEVKGKVKLKFRDTVGNQIVCTQTSVSTQRAKKIETKSLDGVLVKISPNGEKESINNRCTDLRKEVIARLGVPKAVIDNVIFCHQEDSNWPLSEGKVLKQKFDDIFAATRYIQALDSIRGLRKEQAAEVKLMKNDLGHLDEKKKKVDEIRAELRKAQTLTQTIKDKSKKVDQEMKPIEDDLAELNSMSEDVFKHENQLGKLETSRQQLTKNLNQLQNNIETLFEGSYKELEKEQREFTDKLQIKQDSMQDLRTIISRIDTELNRLTESKNSLNKEHGKIQQEAQMNEKDVEERDKLINTTASEFNIEGFHGDSYQPDDAEEFLKKMKELYQNAVKDGKQTRSSYDERLKIFEEEVKKKVKELHSYEGAIDQKQQLMKSNGVKVDKIQAELNTLSSSENRLRSLETELQSAEAAFAEFKTTMDIGQVNTEISTLKYEKTAVERELSELKDEESAMLAQSKAQSRVDIFSKEKDTKKDNINNLMRRHQDKLETTFGGANRVPQNEELKSRLQSHILSKEQEAHTQTTQCNQLSQKIAGVQTRQKILTKELEKKKRELSEKENKINTICKGNEYTSYKETLQQKVEKVHNNLVELGAFEKIFKKYITQLENESERGCPLCQRGFKTKEELRELMDNLSAKLAAVPERKVESQRSYNEDKALYKKLQDLAPVKSNFDKLSSEIPQLQEELNSLTEEIEKERNRLSEMEEVKALVEDEEKIACSMQTDVSKIHDYITELKVLEKNIAFEQSKLVGVTPGRTLQSVREAVTDAEVNTKNLTRKIDSKKEQLFNYKNTSSDQEREVNQLKTEKLRLKSQLQERTNLESQLKELHSTNQNYEHETRDLSTKLQPLRTEVEQKTREQASLRTEREENEDHTRCRLERIKNEGNSIKVKTGRINTFINEGKVNALSENEEQLKNVENRLKKHQDERNRKSTDYTNINQEIVKQDVRAREIDDNLKYLKTKTEIEEITRKIMDLKEELSKYGDYKEFSSKKSQLEQKLKVLRVRKAEVEANRKVNESTMNRCERDLESGMYSGAEAKHCEKLIEIKTTEMATQDLDKYYKALDQAIMKYHGLKLREINEIIKEYWVRTYRGNDIDTIKIDAEDEEGSGASKARRSYNYRVCMVKGDTQLDMRSRCSAGQKVLASIIIRLALAETFCLNCGILALDEPTTNLDEANIESLANSLKDIIEMRQVQKNFQLLVITHSEDFVNALGRSEYVEHYFKVCKDEDGNSKIHRRSMDERE